MSFEQIVKSKLPGLSQGQSKVAAYILKDLDAFSYATLAKLSREISVSETTIIRLAYSLGFDSFSAMQQFIRNEILDVPTYRTDVKHDSFYNKIIAMEIENLDKILKQTDEAYIDRVAKVVAEADMVLSIGSRAAHGPAVWFANTLGHLRTGVYAVHPYMEDSFSHIVDVTANSAVFCISFSRYSKGTHQYVKLAKEKGAKIIAVTDSAISPIGMLADYVFVTNSNKNEMGFNSYISALCIGNLIVSGIRQKDHGQLVDRLMSFEDVYKEIEVFYE